MFVRNFVRDLLHHLQTNATFLSVWAGESQAWNPIGSVLVQYKKEKRTKNIPRTNGVGLTTSDCMCKSVTFGPSHI